MTMAACGEDEFGNLFADVHVEEVHALRGCGSLHWSFEDESDTTGIPRNVPMENLPEGSAHGCYANAATAQAELDSSAIECAFRSINIAKHQKNSTIGTIDAACTSLRADDLATDSDDDLRIVLNPSQKVINEADDSEDGEDFVVLTGNEVASGQEWQEASLVPTEESAQAKVVGGEKVGLSTDEQVQTPMSSGVHPRLCYGGQAYRRHYRYVRANGIGRVGAFFTGNTRVANFKSSFAKSKRLGNGGGFSNFHRIPGGTGTVRGFSAGPEYVLPPNKTVFDIDIDAFKEKPWRLTNVNVSDYFNFELDESSWKSYCKQLTQFCLEVTTQSKISVYEGGRIGQPTACDVQVGVGVGQQASIDAQGQQFRDSDAIFLVDVKEDDMRRSESHQADVGEACKVLALGDDKMNLGLNNKVCKQEKDLPSSDRSTRKSRKRLTSVLKEFSVNELQENGSAATVSRLKTPSPATPPERLPTQGKSNVKAPGKSQSSSLNDGMQIGQVDHISGALGKRQENLQLLDNAASNSIRENSLSRRKDLKRGSIQASATQIVKKQRLDSHQANHGCRYASLLIKKLSRVRTTKVTPVPQVESDSIQHGNVLSGKEILNGRRASGKLLSGESDEHIIKAAERQEKPICMDDKRSKKKHKANCGEVRDVLQDISCEPAKEMSREELKVKKSKKGHKNKERVKSKDKVHLPGCPKLKKGLEKNDLLQGMGNVSMIGFISKGNKFYWKTVNNLCQGDVKGHDPEKMSVMYQCNETNKRTEDRNLCENIDGGYINAGEEREYNGIVKLPAGTRGCDESIEGNVMDSWNALKVLRAKKRHVQHMLISEMRLASSKPNLLASSTCEAHANDNKHVLLEKQVTSMERRKQFEDKERDSIAGQLHLETEHKAQGLTDSALANGQRHKRRRSKKSSHKQSCKNSTKLIPLVEQEEKQRNALTMLENHGASTKRSKKVGNNLEDLDKSGGTALESCQTEPLSTKVERTSGINKKILDTRMQKVEKNAKQRKWHCQETKSFWAFSV